MKNLIGIAFVCILWIGIETVFMQFLHYDSQYRLLNPKHYNVNVITQEDYKQLSNPENRSVKLSSGNTLIKAEVWDSHVLPKYKSVNNGSEYVLVEPLRGAICRSHVNIIVREGFGDNFRTAWMS